MQKIEKYKNTNVLKVSLNIFKDKRGYFVDYLRKNKLEFENKKILFKQDNISYSKKNVLRGLHFQKKPYAQGKLFIILEGIVQDVFVDLNSKKNDYHSIILDSSKPAHRCIYIPENYANSFLVLSDYAIVSYKCAAEYNFKSECGINPFDPFFDIKWKVNRDNILLSSKDKNWPKFQN